MGQIQEFLSRVANIFLKIIRQLHGIHNCGGLDTVENGSLAIDQEIGHLWVEKSGRAAQSCACGGREEEEKQEIFNLPLIGLEIVSDRIQLKSTKYRPQHLDCQSLDSFFVKSKMLEIAVETALSLSSIGMTIQM